MMRIEAIFGGILALFLLGVVVYTVATTEFGSSGNNKPPSFPSSGSQATTVSTIGPSTNSTDGICQCYDNAFKLAGSNVGVTSSQYRTGFEQCRAVWDVEGGDAWTAGWNARLSSRPYEASCRSYKKRRV